jgi:hypothetical protein
MSELPLSRGDVGHLIADTRFIATMPRVRGRVATRA